MRFFGLLAVALFAGSCREAAPLSPTAPQPDVLTIAPAIEAIKITSTESLTAVSTRQDGTRRVVQASWSSDTPTVAAVNHDGLVRAVGLGTATILATYETLTAHQLLRVVSDYAGTWSGEYQITACTRLSGSGPDICRNNLPPWGGAILPLQVAVTQTGATVVGSLNFYSNTRRLVEAGPIDGGVDEAGALVLTGTARSIEPEHPSETAVDKWSTTLSGDGQQMVGRFIQNQHFQHAWGQQHIRMDCLLVKLERLPS